jgi:hypothetical protein
MTQGFTDPQKEAYSNALESVDIPRGKDTDLSDFIARIVKSLGETEKSGKGPGKATLRAVVRALVLVKAHIDAMNKSNELLRTQEKIRAFPFEALPDPVSDPASLVRPGKASIIYLGGYDHLMQSTIVALVLRHLFDHRAGMTNRIPPFLAVIEEAHNFIPSRGEGQAETPSVEIIRKVITEGRKFGTGLLLISQRPSRLDETTLSQCNTFMIFRLVNPRDQSFVEKVMENLSKADSRLLPGFGPGQGIVSGQAVRFPLVIQVEYDKDLETEAIGSEDFLAAAETWTESVDAEANAVSDAILADLDAAVGGNEDE